MTAPWLMTFSEPGFTRSDLCPGSDGGPQELLTLQISSNLFKSSQHWSLMKFVLQQFASWFAWQFASQFASLRCVPMCAGFAMLQHLANRSELHSGCLTASCTQSPSEPRRVAKDLGFTVAGHMCLKPMQHHWPILTYWPFKSRQQIKIPTVSFAFFAGSAAPLTQETYSANRNGKEQDFNGIGIGITISKAIN